ncbi:hypothetical protein KEM54_006318 [Ascosphaera aggregata]|nr:hypothetical protein KEM54_006318 [Ascosphaera aggregata]
MRGNMTIMLVLVVLSGMGVGLYFLLKHIMTIIVTRLETARELENGGFMAGDDVDFAAAGPPPGAKSNMGTEMQGDTSTWADEANETAKEGEREEKEEEEQDEGPPEFTPEYIEGLRAESTVMGFTDGQHDEAMSVAKQAADQAWFQVQALREEQRQRQRRRRQQQQQQQLGDPMSGTPSSSPPPPPPPSSSSPAGERLFAILDDFRQRLFAETGRQHYWLHLVNMLVGPMTEACHRAFQKVVESSMQTRSLWEACHTNLRSQGAQEQQQREQEDDREGMQSSNGEDVNSYRPSIRTIQPSGARPSP